MLRELPRQFLRRKKGSTKGANQGLFLNIVCLVGLIPQGFHWLETVLPSSGDAGVL